MSSEPQVTFHPMSPPDGPWRHEQVRLDGEPVGYLLYRSIRPLPGLGSGPGWVQYLVSDHTHRPVGEYRCSYLYREPAVAALLAHATTGVAAA